TQSSIASFPYPGEVKCLAFSPDSKMLAAGGGISYDTEKPGSIYMWDSIARRLAFSLNSPHLVNALAFSQDGRRLYTVGMRGRLSWWAIASHQETVVPPFWTKQNTSLAISNGEKTLAVGTEARVILYDWLTRRPVRVLPGHADANVFALAFSPDNSLLAMGGLDGAVQLWDSKTWTHRRTWKHPGTVSSLAFSPDGKTLATACWDDTIRLWDVASGRLLRRLIGHISLVNSVAFTPDGRTIVSGANDGTVRMWDIDPKHALVESIPTGSPVCGIALSDDTNTLATTDGEKGVRLWDVSSGASQGMLTRSRMEDKRFRFPPDGRMLASVFWGMWNPRLQKPDNFNLAAEGSSLLTYASRPVANDYSITMKDLILRRSSRGLANDAFTIHCLALAPDGDTVAVTGHDRERTKYEDGTLELWSLRTRQWLGSVRGAHSNDITALAFSRDGRSLATGGWDHKVQIWEVSKIRGQQDGRVGHRTLEPNEMEDQGAQVFAIAFTRDNKTLAVGTADHKINLCSLDTGEVITVLKGQKGSITSLALSSDDSLLVSGSVDGTVRFWRAAPFDRTDDPVRTNLYNLWNEKR
ncbi:MAG: repeat-containing protein, partial [Chthonomonadales bacterium]|nr:repeat-containing protein [Chthonomonadales bacterium]